LRPGAVYQPVEVVDAEDKWVIYYRETFDWSNPNPAKPDDFEQFTSRMARPEERVTTELWNELFPMRPQDVFDMLYDGLDVNNARLYIARRPGDLIELQVISQEFTAYRTFRIDEHGRRVAHHYSFRVAASERGKGLGTTFLRNSMALYEAMGVERVDTTATSSSAGDIGAYVWARFGFIPSRAEWDQLRQGYLRNLYRYQKPNLSPAHQRVVEQALNNR